MLTHIFVCSKSLSSLAQLEKKYKVSDLVECLLTCGVVDLRSSDVVPPLLQNFTQDQSGM